MGLVWGCSGTLGVLVESLVIIVYLAHLEPNSLKPLH